MKQVVNLYIERLQPIRESLSLNRLLLLWGMLLLLLVAGWLYLLWQLNGVNASVTVAEQQLSATQQQIQGLKSTLEQRKPSAVLVKEHERLLKSVEQKQQLLTFLSKQQQESRLLYSPVIQHLSDIDLPELWLTSFSLQPSQSEFHGVSLKAAAVAQWLERLRQNSYFQGQHFKEINLQQLPGNSAVSFELSAQPGVLP